LARCIRETAVPQPVHCRTGGGATRADAPCHENGTFIFMDCRGDTRPVPVNFISGERSRKRLQRTCLNKAKNNAWVLRLTMPLQLFMSSAARAVATAIARQPRAAGPV